MITALCLQGLKLATATYKFDFCLILSLSRSLQKQQFFLSDCVNWSNDGLAKIFTDVIPRI